MVISTDAEKELDKVQHPFMKVLENHGLERMYPNLIKAIYNKATASIILNSEKLKTLTFEIGNKTRRSTPTTVF